MVSKKMILRAQAEQELRTKTHLNSIQIEKVLGDLVRLDSALIARLIEVSDKAERKSRGLPSGKVRHRVAGKNKFYTLGKPPRKLRTGEGNRGKTTFDRAIRRAERFVDQEALS